MGEVRSWIIWNGVTKPVGRDGERSELEVVIVASIQAWSRLGRER